MITDLQQIDGASSMVSAQEEAQPSTPALFQVPQDQEFYQLPHEVRKDVRTWLTLLKEIANAPKVKPACAYHASRLQGRRGFSAASILRNYYAFTKSGHDWRVLVDHAKVGASKSSLPTAFIGFWKKLVEENQRADAPAWRELKNIWRTHHTSAGVRVHSIPGYKDWPAADETTGLPLGWSYSTLARHTSSQYEKKATRIGTVAASSLRKKVLASRLELKVGQYIEWDDQVYDQKVNFLGRRQTRAMRPLGLNALDLASACCVSYSFKPTLWNDQREAKEQLKEIDMMWFVVNFLLTHGNRTDDLGTTLIVEHGTAAIRDDFEKRIFDATGGKVKIDRSGITGDPAYAGMFEGARRGNFRFKASIESFFNLVRNETAALPGQVGKDRDHSPEQMAGLERYNAKLLQLVDLLPPEEAAKLKFPVLEWNQWVRRVMSIYDAINKRTDHDLEAWRLLDHVTTDWRFPSLPNLNSQEQWLSMDQFFALAPEHQSIIKPLIESDPTLTRMRQLSPWEVWTRGKRELTPLQQFQLPDLLGPEAGIERTVNQGVIAFEDQDIQPEPLIFDAALQSTINPQPSTSLPDGSTFLTYINPFAPSALILCDARGRYIGTLPVTNRPSRGDYDAIKREMGKARHHEAELLRAIGLRHTDQAQAKTEMHRHNADVISGHFQDKQDSVARAKAALAKSNASTHQEETDL